MAKRGKTYAVTDPNSAAGKRMKAAYLKRGYVDSKSKYAPAGMRYNKDTYDPLGHKRKSAKKKKKKKKTTAQRAERAAWRVAGY